MSCFSSTVGPTGWPRACAIRSLGLALFVLAVGGASPAASADGVPAFRPESLKALEKGEVLLEQLEPAGGSGVAVRASGVIEAPPGRVWPVLRDCEHYREFLPGVRESELKSRVNGVAVCATEIDLPFPLGDLRSEMRVSETEIDGGFRRSWTLIEGNYERNQGSWTLLPFSLLTLMVRFDRHFHLLPKPAQPGSRPFSRRPLPTAEEPRQSTQTGLFAHHVQQSTQGSSSLTLDQTQEYDHKVLPLALTETGAKELGELA